MDKMSISPVGRIAVRGGEAVIELNREFIPALTGLDGFGYIQVLWWFDGCDNETSRSRLTETSPYKKGPLSWEPSLRAHPSVQTPLPSPAPV